MATPQDWAKAWMAKEQHVPLVANPPTPLGETDNLSAALLFLEEMATTGTPDLQENTEEDWLEVADKFHLSEVQRAQFLETLASWI